MTLDRNDFFTGYIEEVQTYIPILQSGIQLLRTNPNNRQPLEEIHRLTHIIKGASSMVGVSGLSQIAGCMENALDKIQDGNLSLSKETIAAMQTTVDRIASYCQQIQHGTPVDDNELLSLTEAAFNKAEPNSASELIPDHICLFPDKDEELRPETDTFPVDDDLLIEFFNEAEDHIETLHNSIQYLQEHVVGVITITNEIREVIRQIRRSVHTLKGAASVIGLTKLSSYAHSIEDVLDWLYESANQFDQKMIPPLALSLDMLATMVRPDGNNDQLLAEEVLSNLRSYLPERLQSTDNIDPDLQEDLLSQAVLDALDTPLSVPEPIQFSNESSLKGELFTEDEKHILREGFFEESEEHLQDIHQSLRSLSENIKERGVISPQQKEEVRRVRRAVHTIKGASAVIGLRDISLYAHHVEDFLDWLYERAQFIDPSLVDALVESLDYLGLLIESPINTDLNRQNGLIKLIKSFTYDNHIQNDNHIAQNNKESSQSELVTLNYNSNINNDTVISIPEIDGEYSKTIRINQNHIDKIINFANELLVGISGFDQNMGLFKTALEELEMTSHRLKDIALELETKFEVKALEQLSGHFAILDKSISGVKTSQSFTEFDSMELDRYTQLNLIIRSLNESAIDVTALHTNLGNIYSGIGGDISRQHRVVRELQVQMMRTRMSPMSTLSSRLSRTMRDVASRLGKRVRLVVEGDRVELDRMVWEKLADPFMHLVRNAVHHGIEESNTRKELSKPAIATITLTGRREGNHVILRFSDDGQGLDFDVIRERARQFGLGTKVDQMDELQLTDLIFHPGFSTKTISEISGRGVGMDVVMQNVKELQGSITVETERGVGTTFILRIPLNLGVARSLMITIGDITYAIPLDEIKDIHRLDKDQIYKENGFCMISGEKIPWYSLPNLLKSTEPNPEEDRPLVMTLAYERETIALSIPKITGQKELVIKGLGTHLRSVPGVSGAAVMGDGSIVPMLDVFALIQADAHTRYDDETTNALEIPTSFTVMIIDDSISIRRVMSRLVTSNGWVPIEAKDGLDAIEQLEMAEFRPNCIILDIEMPRMNGFEFLAKLPNIPGGKHIPVIMLTSRTSIKHQEKAFQLGAKAFLNKPCKDEEFTETVLRLTGNAVNNADQIRMEAGA